MLLFLQFDDKQTVPALFYRSITNENNKNSKKPSAFLFGTTEIIITITKTITTNQYCYSIHHYNHNYHNQFIPINNDSHKHVAREHCSVSAAIIIFFETELYLIDNTAPMVVIFIGDATFFNFFSFSSLSLFLFEENHFINENIYNNSK